MTTLAITQRHDAPSPVRSEPMLCCVCGRNHPSGLAERDKPWTVCVYDDGSRQVFCRDCHRNGMSAGYSYLGDEPYQHNRKG
jgi:hypothetical protein